MSEESKSAEATARSAAAQAEDEARLATARHSMADTSSTGTGPSFAGPQVEASLTSAELVRWAEQMEVEIARFKGAIEEKVKELTASASSMRDGATACAAQSAHLEIAFQLFVDNHADCALTSRDDGHSRERLRQRTQLSEDTALWKRCRLYVSTGLSGDASLLISATLLQACSLSWGRPSM